MSAVKKTAKFSLYIFSLLVLILVGGAIYVYVNMNSLAKQLTEQVASDALGVDVNVGEMDINIAQKRIVVRDLRIANPKGYTNPNAIIVNEIIIVGESFSKEFLTFANIAVDGTNVSLEVDDKGTNLGDLKKNIDAKSAGSAQKSKKSSGNSNKSGENIKVIVKKFSLTGAQLHPSVTLIRGDFAPITVADIHLRDIGKRENGIVAGEAIAQIMDAVLKQFNQSAGSAGFLQGMSIDALKDIGISGMSALKGDVKKDINDLKDSVKGLKGLFK